MSVLVLSRRVIISFVLLVIVVGLITSNRFWRWMYPIGYQPVIQQAATVNHLDPLLIASVIRVESQFHEDDVSHAGAQGLMQLMPDTAKWIATQMEQQKQPVPQTRQLDSPTLNVRLGAWYIRYLIEQFHGNRVAAIAAYNSGPKRVQEWLSNGTWDGRLPDIMEIPVGETRHFVDRVFYNYDLYKRIYGNDNAWQRQAAAKGNRG